MPLLAIKIERERGPAWANSATSGSENRRRESTCRQLRQRADPSRAEREPSRADSEERRSEIDACERCLEDNGHGRGRGRATMRAWGACLPHSDSESDSESDEALSHWPWPYKGACAGNECVLRLLMDTSLSLCLRLRLSLSLSFHFILVSVSVSALVFQKHTRNKCLFQSGVAVAVANCCMTL